MPYTERNGLDSRDGGAAVTDGYPGERPHRFTGGTVKRIAIDVSGQPYLDLER